MPPDPPAIDTSQIDQASNDISMFNNLAGLASDAMGKLQGDLDRVGISLGNMGNLARNQATQFGVLTTAVVGAKESFASFANVDTSRLDTFSGQVNDLFTMITAKGTAPAVAADAIQRMASTLISLGIDSTKVKSAMGGTLETFIAFASNTLKQVDNTRRLQNSFMQLTGSAGDLGELYKAVGADLGDLDKTTLEYSQTMINSMLPTHTRSIDIMYQYAAQLNTLPGGFKALTGSMDVAGNKMSVLTATVNFAIGSQRKYEDVVNDMRQAILSYGVGVDQALKFTARISEISEKYGARVEDVRNQLNSSTDAFKMFTTGGDGADNMLQSISGTMAGFIGQMENIGVPAKNAMEMFNTITQRIQGMSEAQAAFLSSTTGGFSDLRGVFQIDEMLGKGDFQSVYNKIQSQIKQMTGNIVSREEAAASPQAAEQYMRQIQILRQGPMGQMAKTRQEAETLLKAMKEGTGMPTASTLRTEAGATVADYAKRGNEIGERQTTLLSKIETQLEAMRMQAGNAMLPGLENALAMRSSTGGAGTDGRGRGINTGFRDRTVSMESGSIPPTGPMATTMTNLEKIVTDLPKDIKDSFKSFTEAFTSGNQGTTQAGPDTVMAPQISGYTTPGQQIGMTARTAQTQAGPATPGDSSTIPGSTGGPLQRANGPIPVVLTGDNKFTVTINCPNCGNKYEQTAYGRVNNPASR